MPFENTDPGAAGNPRRAAPVRRDRIRSALFILLFLGGLAGCAGKRVDPPPEGGPYQVPWGAVDEEIDSAARPGVFAEQAARELADYVYSYRQEHPGGRIPYRMLALSGGGSRGAYGAGVLSGWTESGNRPEFSVVTGVSAGALLATVAFLGPEYDHKLKLVTEVENSDIFKPNGRLALINRAGLNDTAPLRQLLETEIDESMIEAVGEEYRRGRSLFIGTTNLDAKVFTIWDMGKIASSDRVEKYDLYRDVILASASFPVVFPPVYLPYTDDDGNTYLQMHTDGGLRETVFAFDFLGETRQALGDLGLDWDADVDAQIYLLNNGKIFEDETNRVVEPTTLAVAIRTLLTLIRSTATASIYNIWLGALTNDARVSLAFIPEKYDLTLPALEFDREKMRSLYEFGYRQAVEGEAWFSQDPPKDMDELREILEEFYSHLNPLNPSLEDEGVPGGVSVAE